MNITKEELGKRGFVAYKDDPVTYCYYLVVNKKRGIDVNVFFEDGIPKVEVDWATETSIPVDNCKSLEDLDNLIKLFS